MVRRLASAGMWLSAAALVVLAARSLAYGLAPATPLAATLRRSAGGPNLVVVAVVAIAVCIALAAAVLWLAAVGVRERAALTGEERPRLDVRRIGAHTAALTLVAGLGFAAFESYLHLRAGLGWHGIHCLLGPVHRDALPFLGGLSLVAAALIEASRHVLRWMRRTLRLLLECQAPAGQPALLVLPRPVFGAACAQVALPRSRGPPFAA